MGKLLQNTSASDPAPFVHIFVKAASLNGGAPFVHLYLTVCSSAGAFLIPYCVMLVFGGLPLFFMELALGQFHRCGCLTLWKRICPALKAVVSRRSDGGSDRCRGSLRTRRVEPRRNTVCEAKSPFYSYLLFVSRI
ncbi:unnamed protein product [Plutella xylostella]|uniref:(diamondback moth) hypothetical protein n=1 Tax=Plutella xylostella TaxID=51655 RepID=A0A8S4FED7_PLUXY|nr:unnamed protein product [Plutella xylostella]